MHIALLQIGQGLIKAGCALGIRSLWTPRADGWKHIEKTAVTGLALGFVNLWTYVLGFGARV